MRKPTVHHIAQWLDHVAKLTIGPSLDAFEAAEWRARPCVSCDEREIVRRALVADALGHGYLLSDEQAKAMLSAARDYARELGIGKDSK